MHPLCQQEIHAPQHRSPITALFDDLIGASEKRRWDGEANRLSRLQIDHQLKAGRLLDWKLGWLGTLQDLVYENGGPAVHINFRAEISRQPAVAGELSPRANGRYMKGERQLCNPFGRQARLHDDGIGP